MAEVFFTLLILLAATGILLIFGLGIAVNLMPETVAAVAYKIYYRGIPAMHRWGTHFLIRSSGCALYRKYKKRMLIRAKRSAHFNRKTFEARMSKLKAEYMREAGIDYVRRYYRNAFPDMESHISSYPR